jgi:hypothetical protein
VQLNFRELEFQFGNALLGVFRAARCRFGSHIAGGTEFFGGIHEFERTVGSYVRNNFTAAASPFWRSAISEFAIIMPDGF